MKTVMALNISKMQSANPIPAMSSSFGEKPCLLSGPAIMMSSN